jgi:hypothetical protein
MALIGCAPKGRNIEQHDVFFGIGHTIADVLPDIKAFWPEAGSSLHLDAWRAVTLVNGQSVSVVEDASQKSDHRLFFINLGGYKRGEFEEFHYKMIVAAPGKGDAVKQSKQTAFFKHTGIKGANSHIDDKYGVDVDDIFAISDILPANIKDRYSIVLSKALPNSPEDEIHLGYFKPGNVEKWAK